MNKFDKNMEEIFDVPQENSNILPKPIKKEIIKHESLDNDLKNDYEKSRETYHELIDKGKEAMDDLLTIAKDSEKARDFEVAATILKNLIEANDKLIDIHKKVRDIINYKPEKETTTIKNALFVGSTTELSKLVKELNQKDITDLNNITNVN